MVTNVTWEYRKAEEEYLKAKTIEEKIKALKKMLALVPKHKGTEKLIANLQIRLKKLKEELKREKKRKGRKISFRKEGFLIALVGFTNTGKSYFLNKYCNKNIASSPRAFETTSIEVGTLKIKGAKLQVVEIPSIYEGFKEKYGYCLSIIDASDAIMVFGDESCLKEIEEYIKGKPIIKFVDDLNYIEKEVKEKLKLIIVFTKRPKAKEIDGALFLKEGSTIKDLAEEIHKDLIENFKFAKVYRNGKMIIAKNLSFTLQDGDIVEIHA